MAANNVPGPGGQGGHGTPPRPGGQPTGQTTGGIGGGQTVGGAGGGNAARPEQGGGGTLHDIKDRVTDAVGSVADRARDLASHAGDRLSDAWKSTRETVSEATDMVGDRATETWDGFTHLISRNPVTAVCIAFGLGCLAASLFSVGWSSNMGNRMSRASD
jgi:ElaB/YqjD/DUF883 family membrane-anchored ribosome-binding protein